LLVAEATALAPLWLSATNTWWLGRHNPTRFAFAIDNFEYKQDHIALRDALRRRGIDRVQVLYPGLTQAELNAYVPGALERVPPTPLEPGWCVVNVLLEQYIPAILAASPATLYHRDRYLNIVEAWKPYWDQVKRGEDHGYIAGTYHLYYLPGPPAAAKR
jgi:hypothetical protein